MVSLELCRLFQRRKPMFQKAAVQLAPLSEDDPDLPPITISPWAIVRSEIHHFQCAIYAGMPSTMDSCAAVG